MFLQGGKGFFCSNESATSRVLYAIWIPSSNLPESPYAGDKKKHIFSIIIPINSIMMLVFF